MTKVVAAEHAGVRQNAVCSNVRQRKVVGDAVSVGISVGAAVVGFALEGSIDDVGDDVGDDVVGAGVGQGVGASCDISSMFVGLSVGPCTSSPRATSANATRSCTPLIALGALQLTQSETKCPLKETLSLYV